MVVRNATTILASRSCFVCLTKKSSRFHKIATYLEDILPCFSMKYDREDTEDRRLCATCVGNVVTYRKCGKTFHHRVASKGKVGFVGHRKIGGKRQSSASVSGGEADDRGDPMDAGDVGGGGDGDHDVRPAPPAEEEPAAEVSRPPSISEVKLQRLLTVSDDMPLNKDQEHLFTKILNKKQQASQSGLVTAVNPRGRPKRLLPIPSAETGSTTCTLRTKRQRSQLLEFVEKLTSSPSDSLPSTPSSSRTPSPLTTTSDVSSQRLFHLKRNKAQYMDMMKSAGFKVFGKFFERCRTTHKICCTIQHVSPVEEGVSF